MNNTRCIKSTVVLILLSTIGYAQTPPQKVLLFTASSISGNYTRSFDVLTSTLLGRTSGFGIGSEIAYGRWKENNLWFFGAQFEVSSTKASSNTFKRIAFLPTVGYQFRINLASRLYFSQIFRLRAGYSNFRLGVLSNPLQDQNLRSYVGRLAYAPVCLLLDVNRTLDVSIQLSDISLNAERVKYIGGQNDGVYTTNIVLQGQLQSIAIGLQLKLQ
jgi:hypothetical protein